MNKCGRRVVITGLGVVSPLGVGVKNSWNALLAGKSGIVKLNTPEYETLPCRVGNITSLLIKKKLKIHLNKLHLIYLSFDNFLINKFVFCCHNLFVTKIIKYLVN